VNPNQLLARFEHKVNEYMNMSLWRELCDEKIQDALFQIDLI
jgi:hypothetical protein